MSDRITRAWELRASIHAFVSANPRCTMQQMFDAHPGTNPHTLRRAIQRMRKDGDIAITSQRANVGLYVALNDAVVPHDEVRRRMGAGGKATQPIAAARWSQLCKDKRLNKFEAAERMRAAALAFLNSSPGAAMRDVLDHLEALGVESNKERVSQMLSRMEKLHEVAREPLGAVSPVDGKRCTAWFALTDRTVSAAAMLEHVGANTAKKRADKPRRMGDRIAEFERKRQEEAERETASITVTVGARTIHRGTERSRPLQNQRGQSWMTRAAIGSGMYGRTW